MGVHDEDRGGVRVPGGGQFARQVDDDLLLGVRLDVPDQQLLATPALV
jgi:hypothetical protein